MNLFVGKSAPCFSYFLCYVWPVSLSATILQLRLMCCNVSGHYAPSLHCQDSSSLILAWNLSPTRLLWASPEFSLQVTPEMRCCSKIQRRKFGSWSGLASDRQPDLKVLKKKRSYIPGRENVAHHRGWFLQLWWQVAMVRAGMSSWLQNSCPFLACGGSIPPHGSKVSLYWVCLGSSDLRLTFQMNCEDHPS